jgi:hypothetical protein
MEIMMGILPGKATSHDRMRIALWVIMTLLGIQILRFAIG